MASPWGLDSSQHGIYTEEDPNREYSEGKSFKRTRQKLNVTQHPFCCILSVTSEYLALTQLKGILVEKWQGHI